MQNSYLVELLKTMDSPALQDLSKFVCGEYFNGGHNREEVIHLLQVIVRSIETRNFSFLEKPSVYQAVFPADQTEIEGKLEKVMVDLNKIIRTYLLLNRYLHENNVFTQQIDLAAILMEKGLYQRQTRILQKLRKELASAPTRDADFFFKAYTLEKRVHHYVTQYEQNNSGDANLLNVLKNLNIYYHINHLQLLNNLQMIRNVTPLDLPEEIENDMAHIFMPETYFQESRELLIAEKIYRILHKQEPSVGDFLALRQVLQTNNAHVEAERLKEFHTYLRNLCSMLINNGNSDLWPVLHELHQENLAAGYLYYEDGISAGTYMNVANVAIRVKNYAWAESFIEEHKSRIIGDSETNDVYRLNKSLLLFATGKYEDSLEMLPFSSLHPNYLMISRRLELKNYFELQSDLLSYKIDAFKMYVSRASRKVISYELYQLNVNFINILLQITQSQPGDRNRSSRIMERINAKKMVADRDWLIEKAKNIR